MVLNEFIEKQIKGRLVIDNPWWENRSIQKDYSTLSPRAYLDIFYALASSLTSASPR